MHFGDALTKRVQDTSPVCVSFEPVLAKLPVGISKDTDGVLMFGKGMVDATCGTASTFCIQLACFEALGWQGVKACWELASYAKQKGFVVIADGKRGDCGDAADAYAEAYLHEESPFDALTVNPYMGLQSLSPYIDACKKNDKGIFILLKSNNAGSGDVQDLPAGDESVHEYLAQLMEGLAAQHVGGEYNFSCVGAMVGTEYQEELKYLRTLMPHCPLLITGYGAEGGTAETVRCGFVPDGTGAIVSAGKSILYASYEADWKEAAAREVKAMAEAIIKG